MNWASVGPTAATHSVQCGQRGGPTLFRDALTLHRMRRENGRLITYRAAAIPPERTATRNGGSPRTLSTSTNSSASGPKSSARSARSVGCGWACMSAATPPGTSNPVNWCQGLDAP